MPSHSALSDDQVESIAEWMAENPNGTSGGVAPRLMAGDADQDLDFDQLDLVRVQVAAKYLSGQPATWGEGDWNGAPGGEPGSPPTGDGVFDQLDLVQVLASAKYLTGEPATWGEGDWNGAGMHTNFSTVAIIWRAWLDCTIQPSSAISRWTKWRRSSAACA